MAMAAAPRRTIFEFYISAFDGLIGVNSLFSIAIFIGIFLAVPGQKSLENSPACDVGIDIVKMLLVYEVVSFNFFLLSSLPAQALKLVINRLSVKGPFSPDNKLINFGLLASTIASVVGSAFLMLSITNDIQIMLGVISCGSKSSVNGILLYFSTAVWAFLFQLDT